VNIDQAYRFIQLIYAKSQSGNITPEQFNNAAMISQISVINDMIGNEKEYQPGQPSPRYGFGLNQKVQEDLRPIIRTPQALVFSSGVGTYPTDSLYLFDLAETSSGKEIRPVEVDEARILSESVIRPPIIGKGVYYSLGPSVYVLPNTIVNTLVTYVRRPVDPLWAYTVVNDVPVYDSGSSQDFELGEFLHLRICARILQFFGVNLSLPQIVQFASQLEQQGA